MFFKQDGFRFQRSKYHRAFLREPCLGILLQVPTQTKHCGSTLGFLNQNGKYCFEIGPPNWAVQFDDQCGVIHIGDQSRETIIFTINKSIAIGVGFQ